MNVNKKGNVLKCKTFVIRMNPPSKGKEISGWICDATDGGNKPQLKGYYFRGGSTVLGFLETRNNFKTGLYKKQ